MSDFEEELTKLLNRYNKENASNTPDFLLARYLTGCLRLFNTVVTLREEWYGEEKFPPPSPFNRK